MDGVNLNCPFCKPDLGEEIIIADEYGIYSMYDKYPVTKGHTLIIPKRHCINYFDLTTTEQIFCWKMVNELKDFLSKKYRPDGFTIHINVNEAGGQTIPHVHIHLIPRYKSL